jgi:hypothetical protein
MNLYHFSMQTYDSTCYKHVTVKVQQMSDVKNRRGREDDKIKANRIAAFVFCFA